MKAIGLIVVAALVASCGKGSEPPAKVDPARLAALDNALQSGVLSKEEYEAKKRELEASAGPSRAEMLAAIDKACQSGVLTPAECDAKRRAANGESTAPAPTPAPAPMPTPSPAPAPTPAPAASGYNDPRARFAIALPPGWTSTPQGDNGEGGVQLANGPAWVVISPFNGARQPQDVVAQLANQFGSQYQGFNLVGQGPMDIAGHPGAFGLYSGANPKGVPTSLMLMGATSPGGQQYALIFSVPQAQLEAAKPVFMQMLESFQLR